MDEIKIVYKALGEITPYEKNPRKNDDAVPFVKNSIQQFGFKVPLIIDEGGCIVAGHTRYKAAQELGMEKVPCIMASDLTPEQVKALRIADNKTAEKAEWDTELLTQEIKDLAGKFDMEDFGFGDFELSIMMEGFDESAIDDLFADAPEKKKEPKQIRCPHCGEMIDV